MEIKYRWILTIDGVSGEVHPVWKDDLAIDYEHETGQQFFRKKLSGKINLVAEDADRVINAPFYSEFALTLQKLGHGGLSWVNYLTTRFYKTDCIINEDDKKVSVQPTTKDVYNDVINGLEKEYNLMELGVEVQPIQACKRPMFQFYVSGDSKVSCLSGGNYFETDRINEDVTPTDSGFSALASFIEVDIESVHEAGLSTPFVGKYHVSGDNQYNQDGVYYMTYFENLAQTERGFYIKTILGDELVWQYRQGYEAIPNIITFEPVSQSSGLPNLTGHTNIYVVYGRMVCDTRTLVFPTTTLYATPINEANDIVANNRNYHYRAYISDTDVNISISGRFQSAPTKWGKTKDGNYILPPDDVVGWYAIGRSQWINASVWTSYTARMGQYEKAGRKNYTIKDCYPMSAVIKALLAKIAPNVTHNDAPEYSTMFYNDQYAFGVPSVLRGTRPMFSPKSNVLIGEYQQPAQKAPITLKMVTDMLAKAYGCYWFIDDSNRFRIEHITYFKNGGSYRQSDLQVGIDLTEEEQPRNEKKWAYGTSEYQFDKQEMAARFQYSWMDDVTDMFKGQPIDVLSPFVTQDKVEDITIANFTTDLDLMLLSPDDFSKDGFALLHPTNDNGTWMLPFETINDGVYHYTVQGYRGTMWWLERNFLLYDMPSWSIRLGETATTASGIKRLKKQNVVIPMGTRELDTTKLVKTYLGNGQFEKISLTLLSRMAKVTLKYDTYANNE